ncbi:hypothetical protein [Actinomadura montaniterrae]|uniref:Uncharacterized protein n=1 Tax=Actinomadura montaniterrae TaxID=1803903 RepID=A0A6L3W800_9ACTN|nr:hypothetical protein [Actinomadura montaniterrae]KAB2390464.1 hypothetical protein F9B16_01125 [Actinomadura montaniterrae]
MVLGSVFGQGLTAIMCMSLLLTVIALAVTAFMVVAFASEERAERVYRLLRLIIGRPEPKAPKPSSPA